MSEGKQPKGPESKAAVEERNKRAVMECPVCMNDFHTLLLLILECGHAVCQDCFKRMETNEGPHPPCPVCRMKWPIVVAGHYAQSLIAVVVQQDANMAAVQAEAAGAATNASIAASDAAAELATVRADAARAAATAAAELAALKAKHAPPAPAAAAGSGSGSSRVASAAAKKARESSEKDEVEKSMWQVDKEKETLNRAKKEKREEDKDKDWNPKRRR